MVTICAMALIHRTTCCRPQYKSYRVKGSSLRLNMPYAVIATLVLLFYALYAKLTDQGYRLVA